MSNGNPDLRVDRYLCAFAEFKPGEVQKLTGMAPALQRLWKKRGQMPLGVGNPEPITARVVAEIYVRHQLGLGGLPPSESANIAAEAAPIVLWFALLNTEGACAVEGPKNEVAGFIDQFAYNHQLATQISGISPEKAYRYLYRYGGKGSFQFAMDEKAVFGSSKFTLLSMLDLEEIGTLLGRRAGRPLMTVEISSDAVPRTMWERRLTSG